MIEALPYGYQAQRRQSLSLLRKLRLSPDIQRPAC